MSTVRVQLDGKRGYPVYIENGGLERLGEWAAARVRGRAACLITHPRIFRAHGARAAASLRSAGFRVAVILVPEGERSKSLDQAGRLIGRMLRQGADRSSCVIAMGGGVIGDLAGLTAALFMRGIDLIQVPTSLLSQVDSALGGKVAVNHPLGKNLIGAFHQPRLVVSDPGVLSTLPMRQIRSGLAEIIKSAAIADARFFLELEKKMPKLLALDRETLEWAIGRTCGIKARVVERDEKERGCRAVLNYGHTVGHALEAYHRYSEYLHGEAVAIGMVAAGRLAAALGLAPAEVARRQEKLLLAAGLPVRGRGEPAKKIIWLMKNDKKARQGDLNFVLTPQIGSARIENKIEPFRVFRVLQAVL